MKGRNTARSLPFAVLLALAAGCASSDPIGNGGGTGGSSGSGGPTGAADRAPAAAA